VAFKDCRHQEGRQADADERKQIGGAAKRVQVVVRLLFDGKPDAARP